MSRPIPAADRAFLRPTSTTDGDQAVKRTDRFTRKMIQFRGSFAGGWDVDLEGSVDGVTWVSIAAGITGPTTVEPATTPAVDNHWRFMRVTADVVGTQDDAALSIEMSALSDP